MENLGYEYYIAKSHHSPIITTFCYPNFKDFTFNGMYGYLKSNGFVIYPGKLSNADTFRVGNIGDLKVNDIEILLEFIKIYTDTISK